MENMMTLLIIDIRLYLNLIFRRKVIAMILKTNMKSKKNEIVGIIDNAERSDIKWCKKIKRICNSRAKHIRPIGEDENIFDLAIEC